MKMNICIIHEIFYEKNTNNHWQLLVEYLSQSKRIGFGILHYKGFEGVYLDLFLIKITISYHRKPKKPKLKDPMDQFRVFQDK